MADPLNDPALRAYLSDILNRGNVVYEWPEDEMSAYRDNNGFSEGMAAVNAIRIDKMIQAVEVSRAASTGAESVSAQCNRPPRGWVCYLERNHEGPCPTYWRWWNLRTALSCWRSTRG